MCCTVVPEVHILQYAAQLVADFHELLFAADLHALISHHTLSRGEEAV
jgi:hypothetical protein